MVGYVELIEAAVKREMDILGDEVSVGHANNVKGLKVSEKGDVKSFNGDLKKLFERVLEQYKSKTGPVAVALISKKIKDDFGDELENIDLPEDVKKHI